MWRSRGRYAGGIVLVALGIFFLVANLASARGWGLLLGLGLACLVVYVASDWYGFAVPACLLIAAGVFGWLDSNGWLIWDRNLTLLVVLGLGFLAIYPVGRRWRLWWPVIPALVLVWIGVVPLLLAETGWVTIEQSAGLARWWPILIVLAGLWVALGPVLPAAARRPARLAMLAAVVVACLFLLTGVAASLALEPVQMAPYLRQPNLWR